MAVFACRERRRLAVLLLCSLLALGVFSYTALAPQPVLAADGDDKAAADNKPAENKTEEKKEESSTPGVGKLIIHMLSSLKYFGPILALVSIALVFLIVLLFMDLRAAVAVPPSFVEDFTTMVNKRKFKEAFDLARQDGSFVARVLTTGMARLQYGLEDARDAALNMVETIKASKEQLITYLATIGTLGPLLGLLGTVLGMILAFMTLSSGKIDFAQLAGALSHALVVTFVGIGLAVPAIFFHAFFRNRLIKLSMETSNTADDLLTQMYHNSKRPAGTPAASTAEPRSGQTAVRAAES